MYCQLEYLSDCLPGRIRHALDELPATPDETYERALQEIDNINWELAQRLLRCVAVVSRPLRVAEIAELVAFDFETGQIPQYRAEWCLEDPIDAVVSTCSALLVLVNVDDSLVIQFSHFAVKEFLTSSRFAEIGNTISHRYHISLMPSHTLVTQACLSILLHLDKIGTRDSLIVFPLAQYAAEHWFEHARFEGVSRNAERRDDTAVRSEETTSRSLALDMRSDGAVPGAKGINRRTSATAWNSVTLRYLLWPTRECEGLGH